MLPWRLSIFEESIMLEPGSSSASPVKFAVRAGLAIALALAAFAAGCAPSYDYVAEPLPATFDAYYQRQLERSQQVGVRPGNEERLTRYADRTDLVLLYIHGFGASRAEGEAVLDPLARELKANTYYARLPGHGANMDDHASARFGDYIDLAEESFAMSRKLGDRVIILGTSTGGLLATYLAARYSDQVAGVVLVSPFYDFISPTSVMLAMPGGLSLIHALYGEERDADWGDDPEQRKIEGYDDYWLTKQKYSALVELDRVRRYVLNEADFGDVVCPVLLLHYYKDEEHQDDVASVPAMREAFDEFGTNHEPHPLNRLAPIADSNHIMLSRYVRSDKVSAARELRDFLKKVRDLPRENKDAPEAASEKKAS